MNSTQKRKDEHLIINLENDVSSGITAGFERYSFAHSALPDLDLKVISTKTTFLGFDLAAPVLISSMTGGTKEGDRVNLHLAEAAQVRGIAMGVGSQRAVIESGRDSKVSELRKVAPTIPLFANLGAVQLNYGYSLDECRRAVDVIEANGLILHLNPLQEALQQGGQTNFKGLSEKIEKICAGIEVPVIVKEVGWGISAGIAQHLVSLGVAVIDVAGAGGTSWSEVEKHRTNDEILTDISSQFRDWGIPTTEALKQVHAMLPHTPLIASGGLKRGMDLAKSIALGASIGGFAGRFLKAASVSRETVIEAIDEITTELRITMFASGAGSIEELSRKSLISRSG